jgi:hypothetical protein
MVIIQLPKSVKKRRGTQKFVCYWFSACIGGDRDGAASVGLPKYIFNYLEAYRQNDRWTRINSKQ